MFGCRILNIPCNSVLIIQFYYFNLKHFNYLLKIIFIIFKITQTKYGKIFRLIQ